MTTNFFRQPDCRLQEDNGEVPTETVRLHKFIADCGLASRRRAETMIAEGRVAVNGLPVTRQGIKIDPTRDRVTVDGRLLKASPESRITILLHKPTGFLCSMDDPEGRPLVKDLHQEIKARLFPVGRLDFNTSGLLLCTNDGTLANLLMHPRYKLEKEYLVTVAGRFDDLHLDALRNGVELDDGPARPLRVEIMEKDSRRSRIKLVIAEGRNRQVRRMLEALDFRVLTLMRSRLAFLHLKGVKRKQWRYLEPWEIKRLYQLAGEGRGN